MIDLMVRGYSMRWTNKSLNDMDRMRLMPYNVRDILDDNWENRQLESKKKQKYHIISSARKKWVKIRFRLYREEGDVLIIMLEEFTTIRRKR